jgi:hypothetical protein
MPPPCSPCNPSESATSTTRKPICCRMATGLCRLFSKPSSDSLVGYLLQWAHLRPILAMTATWFLSEVLLSVHYSAVTAPMVATLRVRPKCSISVGPSQLSADSLRCWWVTPFCGWGYHINAGACSRCCYGGRKQQRPTLGLQHVQLVHPLRCCTLLGGEEGALCCRRMAYSCFLAMHANRLLRWLPCCTVGMLHLRSTAGILQEMPAAAGREMTRCAFARAPQ